ncbi:MAG: SLC13 family permease [Anaerolineae bacterium]|nr:SLC13 family permease [Anaerolineae bacterium]
MTNEIGLTFGILAVAVLLFVTEVVRVDLVALFVLATLALTGLVKPEQALAGFSNPAVVTVWAMFILSAGLTRTGVSNMIGKQVMRFARGGDGRLVSVLMTVTALLSAFMNNIGVAAMFLPITLQIARLTKRPASRLLMPMAYGSLLGGLILLIGTASNLLVRDALREAGYRPLGMFDFTIGGLIILVFCVAYMALLGQRFLPVREPVVSLAAAHHHNNDVHTLYGLEERLAYLALPDDSALAGKTLVESRIGRALGLHVLSIRRKNGRHISAGADVEIEGSDRLLILGRLDRIEEVAAHPIITIEEELPAVSRLFSENIGLAEVRVTPDSIFVDQSLNKIDFRRQYGLNVLAIRQGEMVRRTNLQNIPLKPDDRLLLQGAMPQLETLADQPGYRLLGIDDAQAYHLEERLLSIRIPEGSTLAGRTLEESRLGAAYGLAVLSIERRDGNWQMPQPALTLQAGDLLIVGGRPLDIDVIKGLGSLEVERDVDVNLENLAGDSLQIVEVMLSPYTTLAGKTLADLHFREKYGISVLAIWRGDRAYRTALANIPLNFGDALLCYGPRDRFELIARDRDFVVLNAEIQEPPHVHKAPLASLIMLGVVASIIFFGLSVSIAAIAGCVLMVATRCLTMEEAYQGIDWRAVFLIAAMLPLGTAMQQTGAAAYLATLVIDSVGGYGPVAVLAGLMIFSMVATQVMPSPVVAVLMSPIALNTAVDLGISPYPLMMGIAYALAAAFLSPVAHPANVLVMSPGGYRFSDYIKQGLPISIIVLAVSIPLLPVLFPF